MTPRSLVGSSGFPLYLQTISFSVMLYVLKTLSSASSKHLRLAMLVFAREPHRIVVVVLG